MAEASRMMVDVTPEFVAYFARNRGPIQGDPEARQPPAYGVSASLDGGVIDLTLTFHAGSAYCCYEWGCHLGLYEGKRWDWLRRELAAHGTKVPLRLELRLEIVVETGALFFDWSRPEPSRRGWYAFTPVNAYQYQVVVAEGLNTDTDSNQ